MTTKPTSDTRSLSTAYPQWCQFIRNCKQDQEGNLGFAEVHRRLTRFNAQHPVTSDHTSLILEMIYRAIALLQAALAWEGPSAGAPSLESAGARGDQWRLVMGYAGFELLARAILNARERGGLGPEDFARLLKPCSLPANTPLTAPTPSNRIKDLWFPEEAPTDEHPALTFLRLNKGDAESFSRWLVQRIPVDSWEEALKLAKAMRNTAAHGALSAQKVKEWKLRPALQRLLTDLGEVSAAVLHVLIADPEAEQSPSGPPCLTTALPAERTHEARAVTDKVAHVTGERRSFSPLARPQRPFPKSLLGLTPGSKEESLVRACLSDATSDEPRLAYATWLDEQGNAARAELIRIQCELARGVVGAAGRHASLRARLDVLFFKDQMLLQQSLSPTAASWVQFDRGLLTQLWCPAAFFISDGRRVLEEYPLADSLVLDSLEKVDPRLLFECSFLSAITSLRIINRDKKNKVQWADLVWHLAQSPHVSNISALHFDGFPLGIAGASAMAESPHLSNLSTLVLDGTNLGNDGTSAIAQAPFLANVTKLVLTNNAIGAVGARALAQSPYLASLRELFLENNKMGAEGLQALAESPYISKITTLDLMGNKVGNRGAQALGKSPAFNQLTQLGLAHNEIGVAGAKALAHSPHLSALTLLDLADNKVGGRGAEALYQSPQLTQLIELDLGETRLAPWAHVPWVSPLTSPDSPNSTSAIMVFGVKELKL